MSRDLFSISDQLWEVARLLRQARDEGRYIGPADIGSLADFTSRMGNEAKRLENALSRETWNARARREQLEMLRARLPKNVVVFPIENRAEGQS